MVDSGIARAPGDGDLTGREQLHSVFVYLCACICLIVCLYLCICVLAFLYLCARICMPVFVCLCLVFMYL